MYARVVAAALAALVSAGSIAGIYQGPYALTVLDITEPTVRVVGYADLADCTAEAENLRADLAALGLTWLVVRCIPVKET